MKINLSNKHTVWLGIFIFAAIASALYISTKPTLKEQPSPTLEERPPNKKIGFFSPGHLGSFVPHVNFSMLNLNLMYDQETKHLRVNLDFLKKNLEYASNYDHRIHLDLGPVITDRKEPESLNSHYKNNQGEKLKKRFKLGGAYKVRKIITDEEIEKRLLGLGNTLKLYQDNIGVIFIADEPYLNGITQVEVNRAVRTIKKLFKKSGIDGLEFGIIFASGLFDANFAKHINRQMMNYVDGIDQHYQKNKFLLTKTGTEAENFKAWVNSIEKLKLTTYDSANNIYLGGGIPTELDVVAFNFYLSTLLFDQIHEHTLHYFATSLAIESCQKFTNKTLSSLRNKLSFIQDGPITAGLDIYENDKALLDEIFNCRMAGSMELLDKALQTFPKPPKLVLIGESSANGVLEFDSQGKAEPNQPELLVEQRILDEVKRSYRYYVSNIDRFNQGLMYFLYPDSFDFTIDLFISGAESAKSVTDFIYSHTNAPAQRQTQLLDIKPVNEQWLNPLAFKEITENKKELLAKAHTDFIIPLLNKVKNNELKRERATLTSSSSAPDTVSARIENGHLHLRYIPPGAGIVIIDVHLKTERHEEFNQITINILE